MSAPDEYLGCNDDCPSCLAAFEEQERQEQAAKGDQ